MPDNAILTKVCQQVEEGLRDVAAQRVLLAVLKHTGHDVAPVHALLTAVEVTLHVIWEQLTLVAWEAEHLVEPGERQPGIAVTRVY
jgi:hypothetical protein